MTEPAASRCAEVTATLKDGYLHAEISFSHGEPRAKDIRKRRISPGLLAADLRAWVEAAQDGETIEVLAEIPPPGGGQPLVSPVRPLSNRPTAPDPAVAAHLKQARGAGFRNPYTFIPALERDHLPAPFADAAPPSHARYDPHTQWVGSLRVRLTTLTPLLLPDTAEAGRAEPDTAPGQPSDPHLRSKLYDVRTGPGGKPVIHGTALKGALRSAYETITASRFGIFHGHDTRLAYRRAATSSQGLIPARVESGPGGTAVFRICQGDDGWRARGPVPAAWIPVYDGQGRTNFRAGVGRYANLAGEEVQALHGTFVAARVRLFRHAQPPFNVWRVTHVAPDMAALNACLPAEAQDRGEGKLTLAPGAGARLATGWLSITGRTIDRKHDERLFVKTSADPTRPVEAEHRELWGSVLRAYEEAAELNDPPDGMQRSRHVGRYRELEPLPDGTLVYLDVDGDDPIADRITGVHPVMIGRDVFQQPPATRLPPSLRPARSPDQLSAADRVSAGFLQAAIQVAARGRPADRGRISFGPVELTGCGPDGWAQDHGPQGVELAPLSSPKPTQFRFYASPDRSGPVFPSHTPKQEGYRATTGLRGRKAYWWPLADEAYWQPDGPPLPGGRHREYLNTGGATPSQVSRHQRWIRPRTVFEVTIRIDGLSAGDLGALIWLLTLPGGHALRLGGGKPLGFGAVHAELVAHGTAAGASDAADRTQVWTGDALRACWTQLPRPAPVPFQRLCELAEQFHATATADPVLGPAVTGFLAVSQGTSQPVHYPRTSPAPEAETYRWFVANERAEKGELPYGYSLPLVDDDQGGLLPYLPPRDQG